MIKLTTLDRRHNGFLYWKYYAELKRSYISSVDRANIFHQWREWCWQEWGASKELLEFNSNDLFDGKLSSNSHWCWLNKDDTRRIYLKDDIRASTFMFRWT